MCGRSASPSRGRRCGSRTRRFRSSRRRRRAGSRDREALEGWRDGRDGRGGKAGKAGSAGDETVRSVRRPLRASQWRPSPDTARRARPRGPRSSCAPSSRPPRCTPASRPLTRSGSTRKTDVGAFQPTRMPAFKGFWVREIPQPAELKPEWLEQNGERFGRVAMLRRALFPLQPGRFTIEPTEVDLVARLAEIGPFGTPFGRSETLHLKTEPIALEVLALPPSPPDFTGAVGDLTVSARLDRSALTVGEAATLTIRSTGRGNLQSLRPPELLDPGRHPGLSAAPGERRTAYRRQSCFVSGVDLRPGRRSARGASRYRRSRCRTSTRWARSSAARRPVRSRSRSPAIRWLPRAR